MLTCIILVVLWALYTVAIGRFLFYVCDLPPAPLFDATGICAGFVLAIAGWVAFSAFTGAYIFGG